jgi:hypothetical protein
LIVYRALTQLPLNIAQCSYAISRADCSCRGHINHGRQILLFLTCGSPMPHLRSLVDHDGAVILDAACNSMLTLNATGGYVWEKLQQGELIDDIVRELAKETLTEVAVVEQDVREFLDLLKSKRLVRQMVSND